MLKSHLKRGVIAGTIGGIAYGLFIASAGRSLVAFAETFETGHPPSEAAVSPMTTAIVSTFGGVLWGLFLGVITFGLLYYFLEPAIPGQRGTKSYLLGAAGFITASGVPWLVVPPQPPGVEQALTTETRLIWYAILMITGAVVMTLSAGVYNKLNQQYPALMVLGTAVLPFSLVIPIIVIAPANPTTGPAPDGFVTAFRWVVVVGQIGIWIVLASSHAWLISRSSPVRGLSRRDFDQSYQPES